MTTALHPVTPEFVETVVARAREVGFVLVKREADTGQLVWEWRRGSEPRPQFVSRRVAVHFMEELLERAELRAEGRPAR